MFLGSFLKNLSNGYPEVIRADGSPAIAFTVYSTVTLNHDLVTDDYVFSKGRIALIKQVLANGDIYITFNRDHDYNDKEYPVSSDMITLHKRATVFDDKKFIVTRPNQEGDIFGYATPPDDQPLRVRRACLSGHRGEEYVIVDGITESGWTQWYPMEVCVSI